MEEHRKRKKIGLLVSGITDAFSVSLIRGVMQSAASVDADILVFPGKHVGRELSGQPEIMYEYQFTTLFSYPKRVGIDGLIISANSISCHTTQEGMEKFLESFSGIPTVLVASRSENYTCISYDNKRAIEEGLTYLIRKEDCRHICLLAGPQPNTDVIERRKVYEDTLKKNGLVFESRMCANGDFETSECSELAMETLLRENPEMDAVFCLNDNMALSAYKVLASHGLRPGGKIKVLGYDNIPESGTMDPPLATIAADPIALGTRSFHCLLRILESGRCEDEILESRLILRRSIGWNYAKEQGYFQIDDRTLREEFDRIYYRYIYEYPEADYERAFLQFQHLIRGILQTADAGSASVWPVEDAMKAFDAFVSSELLPYMDSEAMLRLIDKVASTTVHEIITEDNAYVHADYPLLIPEIYRSLVQTEGRRYGWIDQKKSSFDADKNAFVKRTLNFRHGNDHSYQIILDCLGWAKITQGCLYIFESPVLHLENEEFEPPERALLKAVLRDRKVWVPPAGSQARMLRDMIVPAELSDESRCLMVSPVYFSEEIYGLFLCNITETLFAEGDFIISQMGSAVRMVQVLAENEGIQQRLEEQMSVIRRMNIELDSLSRHDELTGIYNRRGFMEQAEAFLRSIQDRHQTCLAGYVDMNDLKVVNDRFGHDEGDHSLRTIARILGQTLPDDQTLLGRIGGDEFVFLMSVTMGQKEPSQALKQRVRDAFAAYNGSSDKPYNVTVSVGIYTVRDGETITMEDALSFADLDLYAAKQEKDRNVIK